MATKHYNKVTYTFFLNGEAVSFYCSTTRTRNGFCHHVFTWGMGKKNEHTRISYYNRTWERFEYESALYSAIKKFPKRLQASLRLEVENIYKREHEKAEAFLKAFDANFNALSNEQKAFLQDHTPEITSTEQAKTVSAFAAIMNVCNI